MPRKSEISKALELRRSEILTEIDNRNNEFISESLIHTAVIEQLKSELSYIHILIETAKPNKSNV